MSRIIKINTTSVIIGNDDLSTTEARLSDCNFTPVIGDEVDVFKTENEVIVSKKSKPVVQGINPEGIVINVANNQNSNNQGLNYNASTDVHVVNKGWFLFWAFFFRRNWCSSILCRLSSKRNTLFFIQLDFYSCVFCIFRIYGSLFQTCRCKWQYTCIK